MGGEQIASGGAHIPAYPEGERTNFNIDLDNGDGAQPPPPPPPPPPPSLPPFPGDDAPAECGVGSSVVRVSVVDEDALTPPRHAWVCVPAHGCVITESVSSGLSTRLCV